MSLLANDCRAFRDPYPICLDTLTRELHDVHGWYADASGEKKSVSVSMSSSKKEDQTRGRGRYELLTEWGRWLMLLTTSARVQKETPFSEQKRRLAWLTDALTSEDLESRYYETNPRRKKSGAYNLDEFDHLNHHDQLLFHAAMRDMATPNVLRTRISDHGEDVMQQLRLTAPDTEACKKAMLEVLPWAHPLATPFLLDRLTTFYDEDKERDGAILDRAYDVFLGTNWGALAHLLDVVRPPWSALKPAVIDESKWASDLYSVLLRMIKQRRKPNLLLVWTRLSCAWDTKELEKDGSYQRFMEASHDAGDADVVRVVRDQFARSVRPYNRDPGDWGFGPLWGASVAGAAGFVDVVVHCYLTPYIADSSVEIASIAAQGMAVNEMGDDLDRLIAFCTEHDPRVRADVSALLPRVFAIEILRTSRDEKTKNVVSRAFASSGTPITREALETTE